MIIIGRHDVAGDIRSEIQRLESLLIDLRRAAEGILPAAGDLAGAPIIDHWTEAMRPEPCLAGKIHGHPDCRGPVSVTSGIWMHAPDLGWTRTLSRFYRLGRTIAQDGEQRQ